MAVVFDLQRMDYVEEKACAARCVLDNDYGDLITFFCDKPKGHVGEHSSSGSEHGNTYTITWRPE